MISPRRLRRSRKLFGADIEVAFEQQVVGAHEGGIVVEHLGRHRLAVQPLLQVREGARRIVGTGGAADQKFAVDDAFEIHRPYDIGKAPVMSSPERE
jgi:hypothetical protein